jgi:hypothetical protein
MIRTKGPALSCRARARGDFSRMAGMTPQEYRESPHGSFFSRYIPVSRTGESREFTVQ